MSIRYPRIHGFEPRLGMLLLVVVVAMSMFAGVRVASAADTGYLGGRVTDELTGAGMPSVWVWVESDLGYWRQTQTNASGDYSVGGLPAGNYRLQFNPMLGSHLFEYYENTRERPSATLIVLAEGQAQSGLNAALTRAASVEGTIRSESSGAPVTEVSLRLYQYLAGSWRDASGYSTTIDIAGDYSIFGIAPGTYRVEFRPQVEGFASSFAPQFYNSKPTIDLADDIDLAPGETVRGIDASLGVAGVITGIVTDAGSGEPLRNVPVYLGTTSGSDWSWGPVTHTDESGHYRIGGLGTAVYRVGSAGTVNHSMRWFASGTSVSTATDISLTAGQTRTDIDLALDAAGSFSGSVTDSATRSPITNALVSAYRKTVRPWMSPSVSWLRVNAVYTVYDGTFTVGNLPSGIYRLEVSDSSGDHASSYFPTATTLDDATDLVIAAGDARTGLDVRLGQGNRITGSVTDAETGLPLSAGATVSILQMRAGSWTSIKAASLSGETDYEIGGLPEGSYRVWFRPNTSAHAPEYFPNAGTVDDATEVTVSGGSTASGIDATLDSGGRVSGLVTEDGSGNALPGMRVTAYELRGSVIYPTGFAVTKSDGSYTITGLPEGTYRITFRDLANAYGHEFYPGTPSADDAQLVSVTSGGDTLGVDCAMEPTGRITGTVRDSAGDPVSGASVQAFVPHLGAWSSRRGVVSDAQGRYTLNGLRSGDYRVVFWDGSGTSTARSYWNGATTVADATPIHLPKGGTVADVDGTLDRDTFRAIRGVVHDSTGATITGIKASLYRLDPDTGLWKRIRSTTTNEAGAYVFKGLDPGSYRVGFEDAAEYYQPRYHSASTTLAGARVIALDPEFRGSADETLVALPRIKGRVVDGADQPLGGITIDAYQATGGSFAKTATTSSGADGSYEFKGLAPGSYRIGFTDANNRFVPQYFSSGEHLQDAQSLSVSVEDVRTGVDASMVPKAVLSGNLTDLLTGEGIAGLTVTAGRLDAGAWTDMGSVTTTASGGFTLRVPAGTYRMRYTDPQSRYLTMMYPGIVSGSFVDPQAEDIPLSAGQVRDGLDDGVAPYGHIRGAVRAAITDEAIANAEVIAYRLVAGSWTSWRQVRTLASGAYDITGLSPGTYRVQFRDPSRAHLSEYYADVSADSVSDARIVDIALGAGQSRDAVDGSLVPLAADEYEPDNTREQAVSISPSVSQGHVITLANKVDWVKFDVERDVRYDLTVPYSEGVYNLGIDLYNEAGERLTGGTRQAVFLSEAAGTVYAAVTSVDAIYGAYALRLNATPVTRPVVTQVWPNDGGTVQGASQQLGAIVSAECKVESVRFEFSADDGESWTLLGQATSSSVPAFGLSSWQLAGWDTTLLAAGAVRVRAIAADEIGLSSVGTPVAEYTVDNEAPAVPIGLNATPRELDILLQWDAASATDLAGYEVYRGLVSGGPLQLRGRVSNPRFTDGSVTEGVEYRYVVKAVDHAGNVSAQSAEIVAWPLVDTLPPTAAAGVDKSALVGASVLFDATGSADNRAVATYSWDFGDGTQGSGFAVSHTYATAGDYVVLLTVTDAHGNSATDSTVATVRTPDPDEAADLKITVRGTDAAALSGAQVVVEQADGLRLSGITNGAGQASFKVKPGAVIAYAFKDGMLPAKGTTTLPPAGSGSLSIELEDQDVMLGTLTVEPMTLEEIKEAGIDISNPSNYHTQSFSITWGDRVISGIVGKPEFVFDRDLMYTIGVAGPSGSSGGSDDDPDWSGTPRYAYVIVSGKTAWLKEMFNVTLNLKNLATDDAFHLVDTQATLRLESGMSLAAMAAPRPQQTLATTIDDIRPGEQKSATWYVSGDVQGEYIVGVDVETSLTPFSGRLRRHYETAEKVRVYGREGITTALSYPSKVYKGHDFVVKATMRNMMPHDAYMVGATLDPPVGATLVKGSRTQTREVLGPDESFETSWTLTALGTGPISLVENEGDISGWIRWSDLSGDEVVVPFLPENEGEIVPVEEGGAAHRYYRVVEPSETLDRPETHKGVWFVDALAEIAIDTEVESPRSEIQTVTVDNRWPSGVFAISAEDVGATGESFAVDFKGLVADKFTLDTSRCAGFDGAVVDAESTVNQYKIGNEVMVGGKILFIDLEQRVRCDYTVRSFPESAETSRRDVDVDIYSESGIGPSVGLKFPLEVDTPVVQLEAGASAEAKVGTALHLGVGTRYQNPDTDAREKKAAASNSFDLVRAMKVGKPSIERWGTKLAQESNAELDLTRLTAGTGVWGSASAKIGGSAGLGPKGVFGVDLDLAEAKGDYEFNVSGSWYRPPLVPHAQAGLAMEDKASASGSLLSVTATNPWADEYSKSAYEKSIDGSTRIEAFFDINGVTDVTTHGKPESAIDRIEITVDDEGKNMKRVFVVDGDTIRGLLQNQKAGVSDDGAGLLAAAMSRSLSASGGSEGIETPPLPGVSGRLAASLIDQADRVEIVSGPKPDSVSQDFAIGADALGILGLKAEYNFTLDAKAAALTVAGKVRDGTIYPLETHEAPKKRPDIPNYVQSLLKILSFGAEYSQDKWADKAESKVDGDGGTVEGGQAAAESRSAAFAAGRAVASSVALSGVAAADMAPNRIRLEVPAGAVSQETTFSISSFDAADSGEPDSAGPPRLGGVAVLGFAHDVSPVTLGHVATITVSWDPASAAGIDAGQIALWRFDIDENRWVRLASTIDVTTGKASAESDKLGLIVAGADADGPEVRVLAPAVGQAVSVTQPWIAFTADDKVSGLATETIAVTVDGKTVPADFDEATGRFWSHSPLLAEGPHRYRVSVADLRGVVTTLESPFTVDSVRPDAPTSLAVELKSNAAELSWTPSPEPGVSYRIFRRSGEATQALCVAVSRNAQYADTVAPGGVVSRYEVMAVDEAGNESERLGPVQTTVVYTPTLSLEASASVAGVRLRSEILGSLQVPLEGESYRIESHTAAGPPVRVAEVTQTAEPFVLSLPEISEPTTYVATFIGTASYEGARYSVGVEPVARDTTAPRTEVQGVPNGWVNTPLTMRLTASDDFARPIRTYYRVGSGVEEIYSSTVALAREGETAIAFWSVDEAGNREEPVKSVTARIDMTAPITVATPVPAYSQAAAIVLTPSDTLSGVARTQWRLDGGGWTDGTSVGVTAPGGHLLEYRSTDGAGNHETIKALQFTVWRTTNLTLVPPATAPGYNRPAQLTALLAGADGRPLALRSIVFEQLTSAGWVPLGTTTTDAIGAARLSTGVLVSRRSYRARFAQGSPDLAAASRVISVAPQVTLGVPVAPKIMEKSRTYTVTGSLRPRHKAKSRPVRVYKYKKVGRKWLNRGYVVATAYDSKGGTTYKVRMKLTSTGSWRLRAVSPADPLHAETWSARWASVAVR